jgi:hypothetical protein
MNTLQRELSQITSGNLILRAFSVRRIIVWHLTALEIASLRSAVDLRRRLPSTAPIPGGFEGFWEVERIVIFVELNQQQALAGLNSCWAFAAVQMRCPFLSITDHLVTPLCHQVIGNRRFVMLWWSDLQRSKNPRIWNGCFDPWSCDNPIVSKRRVAVIQWRGANLQDLSALKISRWISFLQLVLLPHT